MGGILRCFKEEFSAECKMMLAAGSCCGEWRLHALGIGEFESSIHFICRDVVESLPSYFSGVPSQYSLAACSSARVPITFVRAKVNGSFIERST